MGCSSLLLRFLKNLGRNVKATGPYFLAGVLLSALFQRYVPSKAMTSLFGGNEAFGVLMAATIGVPLYACGGGTIPLLQQWLADGMSMGLSLIHICITIWPRPEMRWQKAIMPTWSERPRTASAAATAIPAAPSV